MYDVVVSMYKITFFQLHSRVERMEQIDNAALDFDFIDGGTTPVAPDNDTGLRRLPFHVLVCSDGMTSLVSRGSHTLTLNDGESCLIRKNETHRIVTCGGMHPVSVWCHFRLTLLHSTDFLDFFELPDKFSSGESGRISEACRILVAGKREASFRQMLFRKSAGLRLVEAVTQSCPERAGAARHMEHLQRLAPAIDFMNCNLSGRRPLKEAASRMNLSESRFTALFKQAMGCSPGVYWQQLRLRRAHELPSAGMSPAETAVHLGFYDVFHFSRSFKRNFGITPAEYLRRHHMHIQTF